MDKSSMDEFDPLKGLLSKPDSQNSHIVSQTGCFVYAQEETEKLMELLYINIKI